MGRWALITGGPGGSKTSLVSAAIGALRARAVSLGGFAQEPVDEGEVRVGYEVRRLGARAERARVARKPGAARAPAEEEFCSLVFDGDAFARAARWIEEDLSGSAQVVVIDEVSKLEVAGRGHARAIERALASDRLAVLCVRADQLFAVVERFSLGEPIATLGEDQTSAEVFADAIAKATK